MPKAWNHEATRRDTKEKLSLPFLSLRNISKRYGAGAGEAAAVADLSLDV
jgi:hypothetical protein